MGLSLLASQALRGDGLRQAQGSGWSPFSALGVKDIDHQRKVYMVYILDYMVFMVLNINQKRFAFFTWWSSKWRFRTWEPFKSEKVRASGTSPPHPRPRPALGCCCCVVVKYLLPLSRVWPSWLCFQEPLTQPGCWNGPFFWNPSSDGAPLFKETVYWLRWPEAVRCDVSLRRRKKTNQASDKCRASASLELMGFLMFDAWKMLNILSIRSS